MSAHVCTHITRVLTGHVCTHCLKTFEFSRANSEYLTRLGPQLCVWTSAWGMCMEMCVDMCIGMCMDIRVDVCVDMCLGMRINALRGMCRALLESVWRCYHFAYQHIQTGNSDAVGDAVRRVFTSSTPPCV